MQKKLFKKNWAISIWKGEDPFHLKPLLEDDRALLNGSEVSDVKSSSVADPFLHFHEGKWYMYYEVVLQENGKGEIGLASSENLVDWTYHQIVLREPFHLSYPQVFSDGGQLYMVPESRKAGGVRLYRCTQFPDQWTFDATLLEGDFADATIFRYEGKCYMFVLEGIDNFHIYFADDIRGPWRTHAVNPILEADVTKSRPGGKVLKFQGHLHRITQGGFPIYGTNVRAFRINKLSPDEYQEEELSVSPILKQQRHGWAGSGMHHMDAHQLSDGEWIAAVDGRGVRFNLFNIN
ncbi:MAG TPA: hypothetical protein PKE06_04025 [Flavilitoribacter sp.]|nr:hypothetical protein [Flavilitoribacter sp.]HMQ87367.1 hypothetical protein [Flavilitoribacter sp.]